MKKFVVFNAEEMQKAHATETSDSIGIWITLIGHCATAGMESGRIANARSIEAGFWHNLRLTAADIERGIAAGTKLYWWEGEDLVLEHYRISDEPVLN